MAKVHIPALLRAATEGKEWVEAEGKTVREVVANLEAIHPQLLGRLSKGLAIAIDGEISSIGWAESVAPDTEIQFIAAIQGG